MAAHGSLLTLFLCSLEWTQRQQAAGKRLRLQTGLLAVCGWKAKALLQLHHFILLDQLLPRLPANGGKLGPFWKAVIVLKIRLGAFSEAERQLSSPLLIIPPSRLSSSRSLPGKVAEH